MSKQKRVYLDNAATSWPKPESVYSVIDKYMRDNGLPLGRTTGQLADEISGLTQRLRTRLQQFIGATHCETIFSSNGTDALNLAIHGTIRERDHVVTSVAEHNSVLRPLRYLEEKRDVTVTRVECDDHGRVDPERVLEAVQPNTRLVALIHASNVTGVVNEIKTVGNALRDSKALFLVDAAQTIGSAEINFDECGIDLLAAPGHKGLFGPLGTGLLFVSAKGQQELQSIRQGGTGASSDSDLHPNTFPDGYEPGNHNVAGLVGLMAGLEFVEQRCVEKIRADKSELATEFAERLARIDNIELVAPLACRDAGIVSFNLPVQASELAVILDSSFGIQIRAGFHCASLIHERLGFPLGCARASFGCFHTMDDVEYAANAIREIAAAF